MYCDVHEHVVAADELQLVCWCDKHQSFYSFVRLACIQVDSTLVAVGSSPLSNCNFSCLGQHQVVHQQLLSSCLPPRPHCPVSNLPITGIHNLLL